MMGASEKRKRSNCVSACNDHGTQDGTTKKSPTSSVCFAVKHDRAAPFENLEYAGADLAAWRALRTGAQAVELGADGWHNIAAGRRVNVAYGGVTLFDRRQDVPRPQAEAARSAPDRYAPSDRRRSAS